MPPVTEMILADPEAINRRFARLDGLIPPGTERLRVGHRMVNTGVERIPTLAEITANPKIAGRWIWLSIPPIYYSDPLLTRYCITNLQNVFRLQRFFHGVYAARAVS